MIKSKRHKTAFTLAEVLITLIIIGVIAALTMPNLIQNYNTRVTKTQLKKTYSTLSNAINNINTVEGNDYKDWNYRHEPKFTEEIGELFTKQLKIVKTCKIAENGCFSKIKSKNGKFARWAKDYGIDGGEFYGFVLEDGSSIALDIWNLNNMETTLGVTKELINPTANLVFTVDTNGLKGPNTLGKDIFFFALTNNGLTPSGIDNNGILCEDLTTEYNFDCTAKMLYEK